MNLQYLITFLEGMITFISPCVLPMIPVYMLYFTGDAEENGGWGSSVAGEAANKVLQAAVNR